MAGRSAAGPPPELAGAVADAEVAARAPGRANLIGEHTDYNDGFVLPVALDMATYVVGRRLPDRVELSSLQEEGRAVVDLRSGEGPTEGWGRYVTAVVRALRDASVAIGGLVGVVHSEVPLASGLSSSAALEVAVATALAQQPLGAVEMAEICRRAENHYVGVQTGIMDQLASAAGRAGHALLIDCRDNSVTPVPVPAEVTVLVVDSTVHRGLSTSAYNERRAQCRAACEALGIESLRDADPDSLRAVEMDEVVLRRARHVVTENERVLQAAEALSSGDIHQVGALLDASHRSLADDFDVSIPELDALVDAAKVTEGVYGARLTGAGFGGCTVNLVDAGRAHDIANEVIERYASATGKTSPFWISRPAEGARLMSLSR